MRACITGYGLVDCLGVNPSSNFQKLIDNNTYSSVIDTSGMADVYVTKAASVDDSLIHLDVNTTHFPKTMIYGFSAVADALAMANVPESKNVAVIMSSVTGGDEFRWDGWIANFNEKKRFHIKKSLNVIQDALCSALSLHYGYQGINLSLFSSCSTGIVTIDYGMKLLDEYDYVIVGGADHGVNPIDLNFFCRLTALSDNSQPFDEDRKGFLMGSGAGALILESEEKAKARQAKIHAFVYPAGHASDAFDRTAPSGVGAKLAMEKAIKNAGNCSIDFINAHGTGTPAGDIVEYKTVKETLGNIPLYSNKGKIGHTMAAAGVIETIYSIESMKSGIIPHNHNLVKCDYDVDNILIKQPQQFNKQGTHRTLNNSFGFGGKCSSQVIEVNNV